MHRASWSFDEGVLIRGGISVGPATKSHRKYYGPAVIQAYTLEQRKPGHPTILVDPSVMREIEQNPRLWMHDRNDELKTARVFLTYDEDGTAFIDYLRVALGEVPDSQRVLDQHDRLITQRIAHYASNDLIRRKCEWLRSYHDTTLARLRSTRHKPA